MLEWVDAWHELRMQPLLTAVDLSFFSIVWREDAGVGRSLAGIGDSATFDGCRPQLFVNSAAKSSWSR